MADQGTLFLDEIGEMALSVQVKLLRVLEKMIFRRVGGVEDISVNVRIVAATNRDLARQVEAGTFRADLFYRLNVLQLRVPSLRSRREDVAPLAEFFLGQFNKQFGKSLLTIEPGAKEALESHPWPGNIRELKNVMERSVLLGSGSALGLVDLQLPAFESVDRDLPGVLRDALLEPWTTEGVELEDLVQAFEEALVRKAFETAAGNQSRAARLLGLNRDKFRYRFKQYGLGEE
jgi:DNA-binding NtrC family response regulator